MSIKKEENEKEKNDIVSRLMAKIDSDPELKESIESNINSAFSVLDTIHWYLQERKEFNESHLDDFAEYCIKETVKNGRYIPARMYFNDWMEHTKKENERIKNELLK